MTNSRDVSHELCKFLSPVRLDPENSFSSCLIVKAVYSTNVPKLLIENIMYARKLETRMNPEVRSFDQ